MSHHAKFREFCDIVGNSDPSLASLFEACGGDVALAVSLYFETGGASSKDNDGTPSHTGSKIRRRDDESRNDISSTKRRRMDDTDTLPVTPANSLSSQSTSASSADMLDEHVRAPIQGTTENLLRNPSSSQSAPMEHLSQSLSESARAELQQMHASVYGHQVYRSKASAPFEGSGALSEMFTVPPGLALEGSLRLLFNRAAQQNKWVLLFLYDPLQLSSLQLIRDVLRVADVQRVIRAHYVLSVVPHPSPDSQLLLRTYRVASLPALLVVDPFRSACVLRWEAGGVTAAPWARALVPVWWWICGGGCDSNGAWRGGSDGGRLRGTDLTDVASEFPHGFSLPDADEDAHAQPPQPPRRSLMTVTAAPLSSSASPSADEYLQLHFLSERTRTRKGGLSMFASGGSSLQFPPQLLRGSVMALLLAVVHGVPRQRRQHDPVRAWREQQAHAQTQTQAQASVNIPGGPAVVSARAEGIHDTDAAPAVAGGSARQRSRPLSPPASPSQSSAVMRGGGVVFTSVGQPLSAVYCNDPRYTGAELVGVRVGARPMTDEEHHRLRAWTQRGALEVDALDLDDDSSQRQGSQRAGASSSSAGATALSQHLTGKLALPQRAPAAQRPDAMAAQRQEALQRQAAEQRAAAQAAGRQLAGTMGGIPMPTPVGPVPRTSGAAPQGPSNAAGTATSAAAAAPFSLRVRLPRGEEASVCVHNDQDQQALSQALVQVLLKHSYSGAKYNITIHPRTGPPRTLRLCNPNKPSGKLIHSLELHDCWIDVSIKQ